ncbi:DUF3568 family protein [Francisella tularensis]|uniref:DUF3568 family protein n=1 Tax=Francisella tularensis TaxID=263 RepID=UPI001C0EC80A|nr:DUF3568 family protein [Francisella tularensis]MBK2109455.1 DUF3568 family protein [Francisella tularensis subsp. novicida FSC595]
MKKLSKLLLRMLITILVTIIVAGCASINDSNTRYENGYYIAELNYDFNDVYQATINSISSGITYDDNGHVYNLLENNQTNNKAIITAVNNKDPNDRLEIIIFKISKNNTKIMIKYADHGDSIRSSALLNTINESL